MEKERELKGFLASFFFTLIWTFWGRHGPLKFTVGRTKNECPSGTTSVGVLAFEPHNASNAFKKACRKK